MTLALERVGTERGAETSIGPWAEHGPGAKAASQEVPAWQASTRRHATNVKYALSTFLQDRRTERDVSRPVTPAIGAANVTPYNSVLTITAEPISNIRASRAVAYGLLLLNNMDIAAITRNTTSTTPLRPGHMVMIIPITIPRTTNAPAFRGFLGHK